jgi:hypothetical protein
VVCLRACVARRLPAALAVLVTLGVGALAGCGSCGGSSQPVQEQSAIDAGHTVMSDGDGGRVYNARNQPNPLFLKLVDAGHGNR